MIIRCRKLAPNGTFYNSAGQKCHIIAVTPTDRTLADVGLIRTGRNRSKRNDLIHVVTYWIWSRRRGRHYYAEQDWVIWYGEAVRRSQKNMPINAGSQP